MVPNTTGDRTRKSRSFPHCCLLSIGMHSVVIFLGSTGLPPRPARQPRTPWHTDGLFSTTTICSPDFSLRPAEKHGMIIFHVSVTQQSAITRWWESSLLLCGNLEHTLGVSGHQAAWHRVRFDHGLLSAADPLGAPGRGSHHRKSHKNSKTTCESVLERKYSTIWGRFLI